MSYHNKTKQTLRSTPTTLGVRLGRLAIRKGISVLDISASTGASRATVYNWLAGGVVSNAYRKPVEVLIAKIKLQ